MFDIGMAEMVVIGVVALIVVGPKDLPQMFRRVGQFVGKARGMAREFQRAMEQAADSSGVGDISKELKQAATMKNLGLDEATKSFQDFQKSFDPKKVDAAAEHAARLRDADEANKEAQIKPSDDIEVVANSEVVEPGPAKKTRAKKAPEKKASVKKNQTKKPATRRASAGKSVEKAEAKTNSSPNPKVSPKAKATTKAGTGSKVKTKTKIATKSKAAKPQLKSGETKKVASSNAKQSLTGKSGAGKSADSNKSKV